MSIPPERLASIVARLQTHIPEPHRPPPKPQGSWAGWKVGDQLTDPKGWVWLVEATTSDGASIRLLSPMRATNPLLLTDREAAKEFRKVRKPRASKTKDPK